MKFTQLLEKLQASKPYAEFEKKHKDSFPVAGFFVLDLESKNHLYQIDYYAPSENKIAAFTVASPISMQMLDMTSSDKKPAKLNNSAQIDLDAIAGIIDDEMKNRSISEQIKKIVAILHMSDGKMLWNLSCILSGMTIVKAHIEDSTQTVLKMEKSSLLDIMKTVPGSQLKAMQQQQAAQQPATDVQVPQIKSHAQAKKQIKVEIEKLNQLESAIEKEKAALQAAQENESKSAKKAKK
jgi:hypothetical protein